MANRSYLYSFNKNKKGEISTIFDISEQNYAIPIIFKILISANTEIVPSKIFEEHNALIGDAKIGRKRLDEFFDKLFQAKTTFDKAELKEAQLQFLKHLDKYGLDYFLFEPAEVISMEDVDVNNKIQNIYDQVQDHQQIIEDFISTVNGDDNEEDWMELGIDFSSYLCFTLGDEKKVKKIEKKHSSNKQFQLEKKIAKNPTVKLYRSLLNQLDKDTEADKINETVNKALALNPSFNEQYFLFDRYINIDLDKKIALYHQLLESHPNKTDEEKKYVYSTLSRDYKEKGDFKTALNYYIKHLIADNDLFGHWHDIDIAAGLVKKAGFNEIEIFENLSKKIEHRELEKYLIQLYIKNNEFERAYKRFYELKEFLSDEDVHRKQEVWSHMRIGRAFFEKEQFDKGIKILTEGKEYETLIHLYNGRKEFKDALYWFIKHTEYTYSDGAHLSLIIHDYTKGDFKDENIDLHKLFKELLPLLKDFESEFLISIAEQLHKSKYPSITVGILALVQRRYRI